MPDFRLKEICNPCEGTGLNTHGEAPVTCSPCEGTGWIKTAKISVPDGVFRSYLVEPCLDGTEYSALTDTQKEGVKIILSCGLVDLSDGASMKTRLWNWFGAESTTVANLTALIGS